MARVSMLGRYQSVKLSMIRKLPRSNRRRRWLILGTVPEVHADVHGFLEHSEIEKDKIARVKVKIRECVPESEIEN
jgi:hypothetical protein